MALDEFLCRRFPLASKRFLRMQVRFGLVLVDGQAAFPSQRLRPHQFVTAEIDEDDPPPRPPAPVEPLKLLYEDEDVLVVNKPPCVGVEPDRWDRNLPSLLGSLHEFAASRADNPIRPRIVHRIDKGTSGAVAVAKNIEAERRLGGAFERGEVEKDYLALVEGEYEQKDEWDSIDLPIGPGPRRNGTMRVDFQSGKQAETCIRVEQLFRGFTLLRCRPRTGRTHQIRVHLAQLGFPLAVDPLYGRRTALTLSEIKAGYRPKPGRAEAPLIQRLTLHAHRLAFPTSRGHFVAIEAPLPRDLARVLKQLEKVRGLSR